MNGLTIDRADHRGLRVGMAALFYLGWRSALEERFALVAVCVTYLVLIGVFASIFSVTPFDELEGVSAINRASMIWYVTVTELVIFIVGYRYIEVREEILGGQVGGLITRPLPYWLMKFAEWTGRSLAQAMVLAPVGFLAAALITGRWPWTPWHLLVLAVAVTGAVLLMLMAHFMVGLLELWGPNARPAHWINQKFTFLLGGLILPLAIYPQGLREVALLTPYAAMLHGPASLVFGPSLRETTTMLALLAVWLGIVGLAVLWLYQRALDRIGRSGDQA